MAYSRIVTLYDATQWHELFVASAGAAAALAGLVFVAVSINVERIIALHGLPERALQTILLLLAAVVVSIVGLVPRARHGWPSRSSRLAAVLPGSVYYLVGGVSLLVAWGGGLAWIVAGFIGGMVGAVVNA